MHLTTTIPQLTIRSWRLTDAVALISHANNPNVSASLRDRFPYPYTLAEAEGFLASAALPAATHFALALDDQVIGGIGYDAGSDVDRFTAEIGYWLGETYWGRGWMTQAVQAFSTWLLSEASGEPFVRLQARVYAFNPASARVLEKAGYALEGRHRHAIFKRGRLADVLSYARLRST
jgi:[ribosomal protein S5]-alanine N-acetyltransferase